MKIDAQRYWGIDFTLIQGPKVDDNWWFCGACDKTVVATQPNTVHRAMFLHALDHVFDGDQMRLWPG